ncbi:MAG: methyltransferase domain-containing protein [Methanospirillum sp.]
MDEMRRWELQADLTLMNPTTPDRVLAAARIADVSAEDFVLDIGCGNGTVLALLADTFGCRGLGIDCRPEAVLAARAFALSRGLEDRVAFRCDDVANPSDPVSGVTVALCLGAASAFGGIEGAVSSLRASLDGDGRAVLGERYWRTERVPPEFARDFADCVTEYELLGIVREHGFSLSGIVRSGEAEFDAYEAAIWAGCRLALARDPDDDEVRAYLSGIQDEYLGYGREYVGWAMYVLSGPI